MGTGAHAPGLFEGRFPNVSAKAVNQHAGAETARLPNRTV